jgi:hypothetical protein
VQVYAKYKAEKKKQKKVLKEERVREIEALGDAAPPKQVHERMLGSLFPPNICFGAGDSDDREY